MEDDTSIFKKKNHDERGAKAIPQSHGQNRKERTHRGKKRLGFILGRGVCGGGIVWKSSCGSGSSIGTG